MQNKYLSYMEMYDHTKVCPVIILKCPMGCGETLHAKNKDKLD